MCWGSCPGSERTDGKKTSAPLISQSIISRGDKWVKRKHVCVRLCSGNPRKSERRLKRFGDGAGAVPDGAGVSLLTLYYAWFFFFFCRCHISHRGSEKLKSSAFIHLCPFKRHSLTHAAHSSAACTSS